ncbi:YbaB/EbfC family nucleoid-associated protein [Nonomuraea sp. SBT364]|uniref:YbaB/EbfC family nucleoid-associated protein n=1 Tax=Nonomuraea sp. SBT364 TaxID=1580530 RepID=UPI00066B8BDB|nr:YbaB/EbfC family nucleoid-associated protein [Nonomuraea sp. SBT364]
MFGFDLNPGDIRPQDVDRIDEQDARVQELLAEGEERLGEIVGAGGDRVRATAAADGRVLKVTLDARAVRDGSQALAEEILLAVRQARQDAQRQADDLLRSAFEQAFPGRALDPVAVRERLGSLLD